MTLSKNRERRCWGEMCRETVPEIGGGHKKGPTAYHSRRYRKIFPETTYWTRGL